MGIIHRDIKADNVLLGENDVLKIADFGVSEMFDTIEEDSVNSCVGSPAYMAPELARLAGGSNTTNSSLIQVSGRKTDIWAMGVLLYYMHHGYLPFEAESVDDLYERIINDEPKIMESCSTNLRHMYGRLLEKSSDRRVTMHELRNHPWVTQDGKDPLLSYEDNTSGYDEEPFTEEDLNSAIESMQHLHSRSANLDWRQFARTLKADHGWRMTERLDRENNDERKGHSGKLDKLAVALDEIIRRYMWNDESSTTA